MPENQKGLLYGNKELLKMSFYRADNDYVSATTSEASFA